MAETLPFPRQHSLAFDPSFKLAEYTEEVRDNVVRVARHYGPKAFADHLGMTVQQLENAIKGRERHYIRMEIVLLAALLDTTDGMAKALMKPLGRNFDPEKKLTPEQENRALRESLAKFGKLHDDVLRDAGLMR